MPGIAHLPHAAAALELAIIVLALACGCAGAIAASRTRAAACTAHKAFELAGARDRALIDAARRLAAAARDSAGAVREEIARAARAAAPGADGVLLYDEHDGALRCTAAFGTRFAYFAGSCVALADTTSAAARALAAGHRVTLADEGVAPLHAGDTAAVAVPLALDAGRACVLAVASQCALDAQAVDALVMLADQASPAYLIALDREHDRRDAEFDGLTGLLTPRAFRLRLTALVERVRFVPSARLALLFVDTDHFKRWNDRFGHAAGDALLRELAGVLRSAAASPCDLVARNGGDEFCIVLTDTDKSTAIERAETLRRRIAAHRVLDLLPVETASDVPISASIGVAAYPADASTANELLERADAAMYHTKHTGRDGVSYYGAAGPCVRFREDGENFASLVSCDPCQQPSSDRPSSSLVSEFPTIL